MNPLILTKISKHTLIGSLSALLAFASKFNPNMQRLFFCLYAGILAAIIIAALWEGRDLVTGESPPEETLLTLAPSLSGGKPKRQYLLSPKTRLELIIALIVVTIAVLVGSL